MLGRFRNEEERKFGNSEEEKEATRIERASRKRGAIIIWGEVQHDSMQ